MILFFLATAPSCVVVVGSGCVFRISFFFDNAIIFSPRLHDDAFAYRYRLLRFHVLRWMEDAHRSRQGVAKRYVVTSVDHSIYNPKESMSCMERTIKTCTLALTHSKSAKNKRRPEYSPPRRTHQPPRSRERRVAGGVLAQSEHTDGDRKSRS